MNSASQNQKLTDRKMATLVTCLRALSTLSSPDINSEFHFRGSKSDDIKRSEALSKELKVPKLVCDVHGIPAVRRRCDKAGVNKDRRFYVCGKEKGQHSIHRISRQSPRVVIAASL